MKDLPKGGMRVSEAQSCCLERGIPFFSYRLPGQNNVCFGAQRDQEVREFGGFSMDGEKKGFVVAPFSAARSLPTLFFRPDIFFTDWTGDEENIRFLRQEAEKPAERKVDGVDCSREEYLEHLQAMIRALREKGIGKAVMARSLVKAYRGYSCVADWFGRLAAGYPHAFVFLVSLPGMMTWMGASPEVFMRQSPAGFTTMSLAGTQALSGDPAKLKWEEKEIREQQFVTDYIRGILDEKTKTGFRMRGPFSAAAGNVAHLCTVFTTEQPLPAGELDAVREALHPTPAVGGFPKREALELIEETERCNRRYYSGYLGPVGGDGTFDWFVNLRCMELFPREVRLYAGGGITTLSDPIKEWEETEIKVRTLLDFM